MYFGDGMKRLSILLLFVLSCESSQDSTDCIDRDNINPEAICYEIYQPVCGCNQQTYSNDCYAQAAGVREYTSGRCNEN